MLRVRDQVLATTIFDQVSTLAGEKIKDANFYRSYGSWAHRLPVLVLTAGLIQALTFLEARGGEPGRRLLTDLARVLDYESSDSLLNHIRHGNLSQYMITTRHTLAALKWYKRFAITILGVKEGEVEKEQTV